MVPMLLFALIGVTAAGYTHLNLAQYIATRGGLWTTRLALLTLGLVFGYVAAAGYPDRMLRWLAFLAGFGVVHVPAAFVLLIKRARHSPKS